MMKMILLHSRQVMDPQEILRTSKASQGPLPKNWTGITMVSLTSERYKSGPFQGQIKILLRLKHITWWKWATIIRMDFFKSTSLSDITENLLEAASPNTETYWKKNYKLSKKINNLTNLRCQGTFSRYHLCHSFRDVALTCAVYTMDSDSFLLSQSCAYKYI